MLSSSGTLSSLLVTNQLIRGRIFKETSTYNILNSDSPMPSSSLISTNPLGFPGGLVSKEFTYNAGDPGSIPGLVPLEKGMAILPGKFHGQRSLAGYSPWGHRESDMAEAT